MERLREIYWDLMPRWLTVEWYRYLFVGCTGPRNLWCRVTGHREVHWYNVGGTEPDMCCMGCDEDLG